MSYSGYPYGGFYYPGFGYGPDPAGIISAAQNRVAPNDTVYTLVNFYSDFPAFKGHIPDVIMQGIVDQANGTVSQQRWAGAWRYGIGQYIAHFYTLMLKGMGAGPTQSASDILANSGPTGLATSESVGDLSVSYDISVGQTEGAGTWNLTSYGQAYYTMAMSVAGSASIFCVY